MSPMQYWPVESVLTSITFLFMESCLKFQVEEMEIPRAVAERSLREHKGDVVEALVSLTN